MNETDIKLLLKAQHGNKLAFEELFNRYYKKAVNVAYKVLGNLASSEDVAMDSFMDMYNLEINKDINFNSYFMRVVVNNSLNVIKKNKRFVGEYNDDIMVSCEDDPYLIVSDSENMVYIQSCLKELPDNQRIAFVLVKYEGYSYKETANIMKTTEKAVESLLWRARKKLNEIIK